MIIDTASEEMTWVLIKFLKDSLDFLSDDPRAKGMRRKDFIKLWQNEELRPEKIEKWMPWCADLNIGEKE